MKTIVICGSRSNVGKTSLAEGLLGRLPNWSALKVTTIKSKAGCPVKSDCHICDEVEGDFSIVQDEEIICQKGTDTARLKEAGAKEVIWLKATLKGLKAGLRKSLQRLKGSSEGIVIEGTSVLRHLKPDLAVYLRDKGAHLRKSAIEAQRKADIIIDVAG